MNREVTCSNHRCSYFEISDIDLEPRPQPNCLFCGHKLNISHVDSHALVGDLVRMKMDLAFSEREFDELHFSDDDLLQMAHEAEQK